jgi:hypothetical protein
MSKTAEQWASEAHQALIDLGQGLSEGDWVDAVWCRGVGLALLTDAFRRLRQEDAAVARAHGERFCLDCGPVQISCKHEIAEAILAQDAPSPEGGKRSQV